jgi:hypothetical protein
MAISTTRPETPRRAGQRRAPRPPCRSERRRWRSRRGSCGPPTEYGSRGPRRRPSGSAGPRGRTPGLSWSTKRTFSPTRDQLGGGLERCRPESGRAARPAPADGLQLSPRCTPRPAAEAERNSPSSRSGGPARRAARARMRRPPPGSRGRRAAACCRVGCTIPSCMRSAAANVSPSPCQVASILDLKQVARVLGAHELLALVPAEAGDEVWKKAPAPREPGRHPPPRSLPVAARRPGPFTQWRRSWSVAGPSSAAAE